jgi:hypothetical protein
MGGYGLDFMGQQCDFVKGLLNFPSLVKGWNFVDCLQKDLASNNVLSW